ncbi:hypothetical protein BST61_g11040 [Cercospora zeina]
MPRGLLATTSTQELVQEAITSAMSDAGEKKPAGNAKAWTDAQKLSLLFGIISSYGEKINWSSVKLPEGRSLKACQVWLDKQRAELKKLQGADENKDGGEDKEGGENDKAEIPAKTPAKNSKKRTAKAAVEDEENGDEATPKPKKQRASKKKTPAKVAAAADNDEEVVNETPAAEAKVKAEPEAEDTAAEMT